MIPIAQEVASCAHIQTDDRQAREASPGPVIRTGIRLALSFPSPINSILVLRSNARIHWPPVRRCASRFCRADSENWDRGCQDTTLGALIPAPTGRLENAATLSVVAWRSSLIRSRPGARSTARRIWHVPRSDLSPPGTCSYLQTETPGCADLCSAQENVLD